MYVKQSMLKLYTKNADIWSFPLRRNNINVFVRTQKQTKLDEKVYCKFQPKKPDFCNLLLTFKCLYNYK